jgi:hypothetical protein
MEVFIKTVTVMLLLCVLAYILPFMSYITLYFA